MRTLRAMVVLLWAACTVSPTESHRYGAPALNLFAGTHTDSGGEGALEIVIAPRIVEIRGADGRGPE